MLTDIKYQRKLSMAPLVFCLYASPYYHKTTTQSSLTRQQQYSAINYHNDLFMRRESLIMQTPGCNCNKRPSTPSRRSVRLSNPSSISRDGIAII